ncbi:MAG TPA: fumarylacetoacetase [Mycobacteriales bacterium]|nr:fumarylacetoacetase [Mycobacteriales bacterium]
MSDWLDEIVGESGFGIDNLPYGVFSTASTGERAARRIGVALGAHVLDVAGALDDPGFATHSLNEFLAQGRSAWTATRNRLQDLLSSARGDGLRDHLHAVDSVTLHLPFEVADYVDFYASLDHATNLGRMFRPDSEPLTPNWRHLPIGYHGRAGTVVVSGTDIARPAGLRVLPGETAPTYGPSRKLDVEVEVGFVVGVPSALGVPVPADAFADHVFGAVLVNDWSARDIQAFEYVPLGPFLGKSFATSVSPWVVPLEALAAARVPPPPQDPEPSAYLRGGERWGIDVALELALNGEVLSRPPFGSMYWTAEQQLAHLTANGASLRTGDLFASGTVSGPSRDERGSLIELSWNGTEPIHTASGERTFLEDGDLVVISGHARTAGGRVALGSVAGRVVPGHPG